MAFYAAIQAMSTKSGTEKGLNITGVLMVGCPRLRSFRRGAGINAQGHRQASGMAMLNEPEPEPHRICFVDIDKNVISSFVMKHESRWTQGSINTAAEGDERTGAGLCGSKANSLRSETIARNTWRSWCGNVGGGDLKPLASRCPNRCSSPMKPEGCLLLTSFRLGHKRARARNRAAIG
jgi:hypothetical protein